MKPLTRLTIHGPADVLAYLEEALPAAGYPSAGWEDAETAEIRLDVFFEHPEAIEAAIIAIREIIARFDSETTCVFHCQELPPEDWAESWKRFFKAEQISPRLIIRPSWDSSQPPEDGAIEIVLDPGMSFGTGRHPTTRACLEFLDVWSRRHLPGQHCAFLDAGCGSGILAIAAALLGFQKVVGVDWDPEAVACAKENARRNGVSDRILFTTHDIRAFLPPAPFHALAANLETNLLIEEADRISKFLIPSAGTALFLAGIMSRDWDAVARIYRHRGFAEKCRKTADGWTSGWLERIP